jgi:hypothetical protein
MEQRRREFGEVPLAERRLARQFGRYIIFGRVKGHKAADEEGPALWRVGHLEDSDSEDLDGEEMVAAAALHTEIVSRDPELFPHCFAWQFDGHELISRKVSRLFGRRSATGTVVGWIPVCAYHGDPAIFVVEYEDGKKRQRIHET